MNMPGFYAETLFNGICTSVARMQRSEVREMCRRIRLHCIRATCHDR
jgi:hypothetical protein